MTRIAYSVVIWPFRHSCSDFYKDDAFFRSDCDSLLRIKDFLTDLWRVDGSDFDSLRHVQTF